MELEHDSRAIKYLVEKELLPFISNLKRNQQNAYAGLFTEALSCPDGRGNATDEYMLTWLTQQLLRSTSIDGRRAQDLKEVLGNIKEKARAAATEIESSYKSEWNQ